MQFSNKKIFIAPHTPRTTMFAKELLEDKSIDFLGFIDKNKTGENIHKVEGIKGAKYDYILILSQNHFFSIYSDYKKILPPKKLVQVEILNGHYIYLYFKKIQIEKIKKIPDLLKSIYAKTLSKILDILSFKSDEIVFISKSFISTNNKSLFCQMLRQNIKTTILTDNTTHLKWLKEENIPSLHVRSFLGIFKLLSAKLLVLDQGNSNIYLQNIRKCQKTLQMWHGVPLKKLNTIHNITYDFYSGPSKYIDEGSLQKVILAKKYYSLGYPRNDILAKEKLDHFDMLLCNDELVNLAKKNTCIVYMPTHREATNEHVVPLDFDKLNIFLAKINAQMIIKFHPFIFEFYGDLHEKNYSNIIFADMQSDIYPILKFSNMLISDYSSVYFDYLYVDKPIIFFDYDYDEYVSNMDGFYYEYEKFTPGERVQTQEMLENVIEKNLQNDNYKMQRKELRDKVFDFDDDLSAVRIINEVLL